MRGLMFVVGALVLAVLCGQAHCQCGNWEQSSYTVDEDDNFRVITAQISSGSGTVVLQYATVDDTASSDGDYTAISGVLSFSNGALTSSIALFFTDDSISEGTEQFFIELSDSNGNLCDTATIVINDDDEAQTTEPPTATDAIVWTQSKYNISEADGIVEDVLCAGPADGTLDSDVTVTNVQLTENTATSSVDFFANVDSTWTFTPSNPEQCISLFIADDIETEGTETFSASFEDDQGVTQEAIICIIDNEEPPQIVWEQAVYTFDEGGNTTYEICAVTNDTISGSPIETMVIFRNGSAISGEDFVDDSGIVLEFQPGDTIQCINITILDDAFLEFEECFYVDLVSDIAGFETSTTKIVINDDEGEITVNVEQEIYTVIEGNELEVCLVTADGLPTVFAFYAYAHIFVPGFPFGIYYSIHFSVGDVRGCDTAFFPGNTYVDKREREFELQFYIEQSEFSDFVEFERDSAWVFIADDDIAFVGFSEPSFTALEDGGSVTVCIELCTGTTNKPIDVLLYTEDDTAIAGVNYEETLAIVTIPALGVTGTTGCIDINIFDDGVVNPPQEFNLSLSISETHIIILDEKSMATVVIQPAFEVCFDMETPRVNGSELFLSFDSTAPVDAANCTVEGLGTVDCTNGTAFFTLSPPRNAPFDITIRVYSGDEVRILENSVRAELTDICDVHFVNKGFVLVNDSIARVYVQPTGPSADARITDLECRCRGEDVAPEFDAFTACPAATMTMSGSLHFLYEVPDGCTTFQVRQINDGTCRPRRALPLDL